jgi:phosphate/sulfate permease
MLDAVAPATSNAFALLAVSLLLILIFEFSSEFHDTGTAVGCRRIVRTIGERIGRKPMTPAPGPSAEVVGAVLIGTAGWHVLLARIARMCTTGGLLP